jgi:hypothetical protein
MMGRQDRDQRQLIYEFSLDEMIPADHLFATELRRRGVAGGAVRKNSVKQSAANALRNSKATH